MRISIKERKTDDYFRNFIGDDETKDLQKPSYSNLAMSQEEKRIIFRRLSLKELLKEAAEWRS